MFHDAHGDRAGFRGLGIRVDILDMTARSSGQKNQSNNVESQQLSPNLVNVTCCMNDVPREQALNNSNVLRLFLGEFLSNVYLSKAPVCLHLFQLHRGSTIVPVSLRVAEQQRKRGCLLSSRWLEKEPIAFGDSIQRYV